MHNKLSKLQKEFSLFLLEKIEKSEIAPKRAAEIARTLLNILKPNMSEKDLYFSITNLDKDFPELLSITKQYATELRIDKIRQTLISYAN